MHAAKHASGRAMDLQAICCCMHRGGWQSRTAGPLGVPAQTQLLLLLAHAGPLCIPTVVHAPAVGFSQLLELVI